MTLPPPEGIRELRHHCGGVGQHAVYTELGGFVCIEVHHWPNRGSAGAPVFEGLVDYSPERKYPSRLQSSVGMRRRIPVCTRGRSLNLSALKP